MTAHAPTRVDDGRRAPRHRRRAAGATLLRGYVRTSPVAVGFAILVLLGAIATGALWGEPVPALLGWSPDSIAYPLQWGRVVTALVFSDSPVDAVVAVLLALTVLAGAERILGSARVLLSMLVTGVGAVILGGIIELGVNALPDLNIAASESVGLDPTIAIAGAIVAASGLAGALWRRRIRVVVFAVLGMFALYAGDVEWWYRLLAALLGLGFGRWLARGISRRPWHHSSTRETRSLVGAVVAVTGLGPLAALVGGGGRGPLSLVADSFSQFNQSLIDRCAARYVPVCDHQIALLVTRGVGPALLAIVPLVLLVIAAWGLRRGRRAAWVLAVAVNAALAALAILSVTFGQVFLVEPVDGAALKYAFWFIGSVVVPIVVIVLLMISRRRFQVRAPRRAVRVAVIVIGIAFAVCVALFVVAESLLRRAFDTPPTAADLLVEAVRRFVPPAFLQGIAQPPYPHQGPALFVYQWVGVLFWIVVVVMIMRLFRSTSGPAASSLTTNVRYRTLLRRGGGTLGFLGTWEGNEHWFSDDLEAAVAYRVVNGVALTVADPLCTPDRAAETVRQFADFCIARGWQPVFYSIHDEFLPVFSEMGWQTASVGEETVMHLPDLEMVGKSWQKVRHPFNRAEREGIRAEWTTWADLPVALSQQIIQISEQWVAERSLPEMGFTLGGLEELNDPDVALLLAIDADGRLQAVTSWMPSWRDGVIDGWTLDFMRRRDGAPNGVMEFLIASAALRMKADGVRVLSLSGAPLATKPLLAGEPEPHPTVVSSFLAWFGEVLEPVYGFASLFSFKSKFHPEYRTLYMAYSDPVALPMIGSAVGRAYLPDASPAEYVAVARSLFARSR